MNENLNILKRVSDDKVTFGDELSNACDSIISEFEKLEIRNAELTKLIEDKTKEFYDRRQKLIHWHENTLQQMRESRDKLKSRIENSKNLESALLAVRTVNTQLFEAVEKLEKSINVDYEKYDHQDYTNILKRIVKNEEGAYLDEDSWACEQAITHLNLFKQEIEKLRLK